MYFIIITIKYTYIQICDTYLLCVQRDFLLQSLTPQQILQSLEQHPAPPQKKFTI